MVGQPPGPLGSFVPQHAVRLACGSKSTTRTRQPPSWSAAARLSVVVVLPTPPFWFMTVTTRMLTPPDRTLFRPPTTDTPPDKHSFANDLLHDHRLYQGPGRQNRPRAAACPGT